MFIFSDKMKALLPFSIKRIFKKFTIQYISSPAGTFGGWIAIDPLRLEHAQLMVNYVQKNIGSIFWRLNPYDKMVAQCRFANIDNDETHAISLEEKSFSIDHLWTKGDKTAARKVRKARKAGITIRKAGDQKDWYQYYLIYEDSMRRWGEKASSRYEWKLFQILMNLNSKHIILWLATYKEKIIAGSLCFYSKNHAVYWHGAALSDYFYMRPVNLLMYEVIKDASDRDCSWFDFNPSGGHEGVKSFKRSFGAIALPSHIVETRSKFFTALSYTKRFLKF